MALCPSPSVLPEERAAGRLVTLWACWGAGKRAGLVGESGQDRSIRMGLGGHQEVQPRITGRPHLGAQSPQPGHLPLFSFQLWGRGGGRRASRGPGHPASFSVPLWDQGSQGRPYWVTSAYRGPLAGPAPCPTSPSPIPGASPTRGAPKQGEAGPTRGRVGGAGLRGWGRWSASGRGRAARGESPRVSESGPGSWGRVGAPGVTPGEAPRPGFASWALGGRALAPPPGPPQLPLHKYQGQDLMCPWSQAERPASSHL